MHYARSLKYVFWLIFHPFDGFWDLKREKRGSLAAAITFVVLTIITLTMEKQKTAFLYNPNRLDYLNVTVDIITVCLVFVLWCVANWCLTSLMDGEGSFRDIVISMGYALFPVILIRIPLIVFSYCLTADEGAFYYMLGVVSYIWAGALVILGTMITHQYSMKKTLLTCILTILGMAIIMFIGLLFFNVIQQIITFISVIYKELRFR